MLHRYDEHESSGSAVHSANEAAGAGERSGQSLAGGTAFAHSRLHVEGWAVYMMYC